MRPSARYITRIQYKPSIFSAKTMSFVMRPKEKHSPKSNPEFNSNKTCSDGSVSEIVVYSRLAGGCVEEKHLIKSWESLKAVRWRYILQLSETERCHWLIMAASFLFPDEKFRAINNSLLIYILLPCRTRSPPLLLASRLERVEYMLRAAQLALPSRFKSSGVSQLMQKALIGQLEESESGDYWLLDIFTRCQWGTLHSSCGMQ